MPRSKPKRKYLSQSDVPAFSVDQALRVAKVLAAEFGKQPTRPILVAEAMELKPGSSRFRMLCGASIAYGFTDGGYNAATVDLTGLGRRVVAPTLEGDDTGALREAVLRPRVLREFLTRYDGSPLPSERIARNVLEAMGVPDDRTDETYQLIVESAEAVGLLRAIKGSTYVDLDADELMLQPEDAPNIERAVNSNNEQAVAGRPLETTAPAAEFEGSKNLKKLGRVFITHGSNRDVVAQLKELLTFGGFTPVVALEKETVSKPVPDKVLDDMRSCGAAIIHIGIERKVLDEEGEQHRMLNQNVLIEIGAAMALYGRKFILLVESGVQLPSNLQGLYEVRYTGGQLDYEATMKLLKAFNDFRG